MRCEEAHIGIGSSLTGELAPEVEARLQEHLTGCAACRDEWERLSATWNGLASLRAPLPDSAAMQRRFMTALDTFQSGADQARVHMLDAPARRPQRWRTVAWAGAVAAAWLLGVVIGRGISAAPASELAALRHELRATREMVTLSLLRQSSASERLRGVTWTEQIDEPGAEVVSALLDALTHDSNVNVRLAAVDALARLADRPGVRPGAVAALSQSSSPLVQIALIDLLVQVKETGSRDMMRRLTNDEMAEPSVRRHAAWGLEQLG
jgi:hypothetical protein